MASVFFGGDAALAATAASGAAGGKAMTSAATSVLPEGVQTQGEFQYATGPVPAWVAVTTIPDQSPPPAAGGTQWRTWLFDSQVDHRGPREASYEDRAYEAMSNELVGEAGRFTIEFNPLYQTLVIHRVEVRRDGRWSNRFDPARISLARRESDFEENMAVGTVTALLLLADVRVGDVVRIAYTVTGSNPILAGVENDGFRFGWVSPILERKARVLLPAGATVSSLSLEGAPKANVRSLGDGSTEVTARATNVPAQREEGDYPNWFVSQPLLLVGPRRQWSDVVAWALPLYPAPGPLPAELQAQVEGWKRIADPAARAFAILRAVQRDVRYFGTELGENTHRPAAPALTWERRYGDCKDKAYLTTTLLRAVGIEAEPALVSMRRGRAIRDWLPSASVFDHVIVRARIGTDTFWLDPTLSEQHGDLRTQDVLDYGMALPVRAGETALVAVDAPAKVGNSVVVEERLEPAAQGSDVALTIRTVYTGQRAQSMRWQIRSRGRDETSRAFADYYRKRFNALTVTAPIEVDDPADVDRLVVVEHYLLKDAWVSRTGSVRQLDLFAEALSADSDMPATLERRGPLALGHRASLRHLTTLVLPTGWSVVQPPSNASITTPQMTYRREVKAAPPGLTIEHQMEVLAPDVASTGAEPFLRKLRDVRDDMSTRVTLRLAGDPGGDERKDRLQRLLREAGQSKGAQP
jgi:hypothetical protein